MFSNLRVVQRPVADQAVVVLLDPVGELGLLDFAIKLDGIGLQLGGHALGAVQHDGVLLRGVRAGEVREADGLAEGGGSLSKEFENRVKCSFLKIWGNVKGHGRTVKSNVNIVQRYGSRNSVGIFKIREKRALMLPGSFLSLTLTLVKVRYGEYTAKTAYYLRCKLEFGTMSVDEYLILKKFLQFGGKQNLRA